MKCMQGDSTLKLPQRVGILIHVTILPDNVRDICSRAVHVVSSEEMRRIRQSQKDKTVLGIPIYCSLQESMRHLDIHPVADGEYEIEIVFHPEIKVM